MENKYPVSRIGNSKSPRLVILLCNPGGDPNYYKRLPEYTMGRDGVYSSSGMNMHVYREYCAWWDNLLRKTDKYITDTDILALEYYPYHSRRTNDIKNWHWDKFAQRSLAENKKLLLRHIKNGVPVFGYYPGLWLNDPDVGAVLSTLPDTQFCKSRTGLGQVLKLKDLENWLPKTGLDNK